MSASSDLVLSSYRACPGLLPQWELEVRIPMRVIVSTNLLGKCQVIEPLSFWFLLSSIAYYYVHVAGLVAGALTDQKISLLRALSHRRRRFRQQRWIKRTLSYADIYSTRVWERLDKGIPITAEVLMR